MEDIINLKKYSKAELQHINRCRLYLKVTTLAEILNGTGNQFTHSTLTCQTDLHIPHPYLWPKQSRPNDTARRLWRQSIKLAYPRQALLLLQTVGAWTNRVGRDNWTWFYHEENQLLYKRFGRSWKSYKRTSRRGNIGRRPKYRY